MVVGKRGDTNEGGYLFPPHSSTIVPEIEIHEVVRMWRSWKRSVSPKVSGEAVSEVGGELGLVWSTSCFCMAVILACEGNKK